jgi:Ca-activated chloride channel family protein
MTFLWPEMLLLLLLVPVLVGAYFFVLKRKKQAALRYASLSIVKDAMSARQ